jgi:hypothetical protein
LMVIKRIGNWVKTILHIEVWLEWKMTKKNKFMKTLISLFRFGSIESLSIVT